MATVPTIWPAGQDYLPPLIATAFLVVIPILAVFLSKRMPSSPRELGELPLVKILVIMILFTSLVFTQLAAVILLGVGSSYNAAACSAGIWICLLVYGTPHQTVASALCKELTVPPLGLAITSVTESAPLS
jgi:hypothetical protein